MERVPRFLVFRLRCSGMRDNVECPLPVRPDNWIETMAEIQPVALVTGSSSGIGEVFARRLSQRGYRVLLVARRRERLEKLATDLGNAEPFPADLTIEKDLHAVETRMAAEPNFEFLVNNAGFGLRSGFYATDLEAQDRMHRLHILAIVRLTHTALKGMMPRRRGSIINVSSVAGFFAAPSNVSYSATKAWINSFSEGLYLELKSLKSPLRVQALCPGFTYSEFHDVIGMDRNLIPKSLWMSPEAVVDASLRGLELNRCIVVPGWRYRLLVGVLPCLPRPLKHFIAIRYAHSRLMLPAAESTVK
jgi:short-subunit dehydrogenase